MQIQAGPRTYLDVIPEHGLVRENAFLAAAPDRSAPPRFEDAGARLPQPFWEGHKAEILCYWKVWELAFRNLRAPTPANGFVAPYIDTAFNDCLFLWDSVFILMFGRYGSRAFDFQRTLDNLYAKQHPDGFIPREIQEWDGQDRFHRHDPVSTGPNVLAWSEWEYFLQFGDVARLRAVFPVLLAYHRWFQTYRTWPDGTYWSCGLACGMDNQQRLPPGGGYDAFVDHGHMTWIDATAQAVLSARCLVRMGEALGRESDAADLRGEADRLTTFINDRLWDPARAFYLDRRRDGALSDVPSIAGFWTLLAGVVPAGRLDALAAHLEDPATFNRHHRVPTLSAAHPAYRATGDYWNGSVWPPTNYMVLRGLTACGRDALAFDIAANHLASVTAVFERTVTVWENYAPDRDAPGQPAKADFVGWGGIGPIAVLFEYLFGLRPDVPGARLVLDVRLTGRYGVRQYPFGPDGLLDIEVDATGPAGTPPRVEVRSSVPLTLALRWPGGGEDRPIAAGAR